MFQKDINLRGIFKNYSTSADLPQLSYRLFSFKQQSTFSVLAQPDLKTRRVGRIRDYAKTRRSSFNKFAYLKNLNVSETERDIFLLVLSYCLKSLGQERCEFNHDRNSDVSSHNFSVDPCVNLKNIPSYSICETLISKGNKDVISMTTSLRHRRDLNP